MKLFKILLGTILVGVGVALYFLFEAAFTYAIEYIWYELFDINNNRAVIAPLTFTGVFIFFAVQHYWDKESENVKEEGLGNVPKASIVNILKVLTIGFLSLVAGASLGPEAILIPASVILGLLIASMLTKDKKVSKLFILLAFVSLFTAFFSSVIAGFLGMLLGLSRSKTKLNGGILIFSAISSITTLVLLNALEVKPYLSLPGGDFDVSLVTTILLVQVFFIGFIFVHIIGRTINSLDGFINKFDINKWYVKASVVGVGLSILYLIGGPLTMFTGNESIEPMLNETNELGLLGLLVVLVVKTLAISWSKIGGLRGGMVFPSIFVAATLASMISLYVEGLHVGLTSLIIIFGMLLANSKKHTLF